MLEFAPSLNLEFPQLLSYAQQGQIRYSLGMNIISWKMLLWIISLEYLHSITITLKFLSAKYHDVTKRLLNNDFEKIAPMDLRNQIIPGYLYNHNFWYK
jgi:hypothetical protein